MTVNTGDYLSLGFSRKERDVGGLLLGGMDPKQIAVMLEITVPTVRLRLRSMRRKLRLAFPDEPIVETNTQLAVWIGRHGESMLQGNRFHARLP